MSAPELGIFKMVGTAPRFLTTKQIEGRGTAAMHIVLRANHHKKNILEETAKKTSLISDPLKNNVFEAMRNASKQGGNALNCEFDDFLKHSGNENKIFGAQTGASTSTEQKEAARALYNAIKKEANIVASSSGAMLGIGRFTSQLTRFDPLGILGAFNAGLRKLPGKLLGNSEMTAPSKEVQNDEAKFVDFAKNKNIQIISADKRIFTDRPNKDLGTLALDKMHGKDFLMAAALASTLIRPEAKATPKNQAHAMFKFIEGLVDYRKEDMQQLDRHLEKGKTLGTIISHFFTKKGVTNIPDAYIEKRATTELIRKLRVVANRYGDNKLIEKLDGLAYLKKNALKS